MTVNETTLRLTTEERITVHKKWQSGHSGCEASFLKVMLDAQVAKLQPALEQKDRCIEELKTQVKQCHGVIENLKENLISTEQAKQEERERIESLLDIHENELGFIEISNHVPFQDWQALNDTKQDTVNPKQG